MSFSIHPAVSVGEENDGQDLYGTARFKASVPSRWENVLWFALVFAVSTGVGYYFTFDLNIIAIDNFTRVLNAYYTLFGSSFHLAAMGFIWNPLPSLLELPLILFHHTFPWLLTYGFAGNLVSALGGGTTVVFLNRLLSRLGLRTRWRSIWILAFFLNPMILYYFANGMSESLMMGCMLGALDGAVAYLQTERIGSLTRAGFWLALCFVARYEAVPYAVMLGLGLIVVLIFRKKRFAEIEAVIITLGFPLFTAGVTWILLNWMIMHNPFYFADSLYSNSAQVATGMYANPVADADAGHIVKSVLTSAYFSLIFIPTIIFFVVSLVFAWIKPKQNSLWLFLCITVALPLFQAILLYKHDTAMWSRFYITYIPDGFLLGVGLLGMFRTILSRTRIHFFLTAIFTVTLLLGDVGTVRAELNPVLGRGVDTDLAAILTHHRVSSSVQTDWRTQGQVVAAYINGHPSDRVLFDTFDSNGLIPFIKRPGQVVITNDQDFLAVLQNPRGRVTDFLVPDPKISQLDAIEKAYPGIWQGNIPWTKLEMEFPGPFHYRLYRILSTAP